MRKGGDTTLPYRENSHPSRVAGSTCHRRCRQAEPDPLHFVLGDLPGPKSDRQRRLMYIRCCSTNNQNRQNERTGGSNCVPGSFRSRVWSQGGRAKDVSRDTLPGRAVRRSSVAFVTPGRPREGGHRSRDHASHTTRLHGLPDHPQPDCRAGLGRLFLRSPTICCGNTRKVHGSVVPPSSAIGCSIS